MPNVTETCSKCGKTETVLKMGSYEPEAYYICQQCKAQLERTPKELMRTVGKGLEASWRKATQEIEDKKRSER